MATLRLGSSQSSPSELDPKLQQSVRTMKINEWLNPAVHRVIPRRKLSCCYRFRVDMKAEAGHRPEPLHPSARSLGYVRAVAFQRET